MKTADALLIQANAGRYPIGQGRPTLKETP